MRLCSAILALAIFFCSDYSVRAATPTPMPTGDHYCPATEKLAEALRKTVHAAPQKPQRATVKMGDQATDIYRAYVACGKGYLAKGDSGGYVYAIAQASGMYDF